MTFSMQVYDRDTGGQLMLLEPAGKPKPEWDASWDLWAKSAISSGSLTPPLEDRRRGNGWVMLAWLAAIVAATLPWIYFR